MPDDILLKSAREWRRLCNSRFRITYGLKGKLHVIEVVFSASDYYHLAGFHYARGVMSNFRGHNRALKLVLDGKITLERLEKAEHYDDMIKPRLLALCHLSESLKSNFNLLSFDKSRYPFATDIKADYIISSHLDNIYYTFIIQSFKEGTEYSCCSIFQQDHRNYETNQTKFTVLKTEQFSPEKDKWTTLYISSHLHTRK